MRGFLFVLLSCVAACSGSTTTVVRTVERVVPADCSTSIAIVDAGIPDEASGVSAAAVPVAPTVVASVDGDLDGDRVIETVRLYSNGTLRVFHGSTELLDQGGNPAGVLRPFDELSLGQYPAQSRVLQIVDIDRRDRQQELQVFQVRGDEDPGGTLSYFVYRDRHFYSMLRDPEVGDQLVYVPHNILPVFSGNGDFTVRYTTCMRDADPNRRNSGITQRTVRRYVLTDGVFARGELMENVQNTRVASSCVMAACPVVLAGENENRVGEILRDLRSESLQQWQPLTIPSSAVSSDGTLVVTLQEEKPEVTHLDEVYLEADGQRIAPSVCADGAPFCAGDQRSLLLYPGQHLRLSFSVGTARSLRLWARGYYVPRAAE